MKPDLNSRAANSVPVWPQSFSVYAELLLHRFFQPRFSSLFPRYLVTVLGSSLQNPKKKMNSHSKVTDQTPIFIDSSPAISPLAEEMEISMLLTPPGYSIYDGDCFTQPEFDALFAFVMNQITIYCRDNYPKNFLEHEARVKLYMDISRGFKFANVHNLIPKYEDGMPHGSSSGGNNTLRRILQVVD
ncbi:hypothetical protein PGTUg99_016599 [Puccinia graminis f. sp. tritici]|uniref:Uncharacterized protein n=1 Tax=Puccinia graminis f. sp. tritici TaxID=56615 RepID=A0A5B0PDN1_PUCGR|nr:hypothetical protein PGTUg99_016218 [Puccinia graminis f. sp. tritici]KAA1098780.1 hypothetical protein PGTUg99_016599 [Puccinia graminis f. sp. tritici]